MSVPISGNGGGLPANETKNPAKIGDPSEKTRCPYCIGKPILMKDVEAHMVNRKIFNF